MNPARRSWILKKKPKIPELVKKSMEELPAKSEEMDDMEEMDDEEVKSCSVDFINFERMKLEQIKLFVSHFWRKKNWNDISDRTIRILCINLWFGYYNHDDLNMLFYISGDSLRRFLRNFKTFEYTLIAIIFVSWISFVRTSENPRITCHF